MQIKYLKIVALRMIFHLLYLLFILHQTMGEFPLMCPSKPHWNFRAKHFCQNVDDYRCLWDKNNKKFIEQCEGYDIQMKGFRKVIEGDITAGDCTENRYQPRMWTTKGNFDCVFQKSLCNEIGQVVYDDGDGVTDRTCGCNYFAGYVFLQKPKNLCYCEPTIEDCTCITKKCPPEHAVDPEYECRHIHQWKYMFNCQEISSVVTTTVSPVDNIELTEVPGQATTNKNKALTLVAVNIVILIVTGIVVAYYIDARKKMEKLQQQNKTIADLQKRIAIKDHKSECKPGVSPSQVRFKLVKQYSVDISNIQHMSVSPDGSLWIGDNTAEKVKHIKLIGDSITTICTVNVKPYGLGITPSGSPLLLTGGSTLQTLNQSTNRPMDSKYAIKSWTVTCFHVTSDTNVVVGGIKGGKGVVIVMDTNGKHLLRYEKDKDDRLFTYPNRITMTRNGNMFIIDGSHSDRHLKLVVIKPKGRDVIYYNGNYEITTEDEPFKPCSILVTPNDHVLMKNFKTTYLYIMNNEGAFITHFSLWDIGLETPYSLGLSPAGNIYVGSVNAPDAPKDAKSTLYELEYSAV